MRLLVLVLLALLAAADTTWDWHWLGPFPVGKTEIDAAPGWRAAPGDGARIPSEIAPGGWASWRRVQPDARGTVALEGGTGRLVQQLQTMAALEFQGWLVADWTLARAGRYALACAPAHTVEVDGALLAHADIYARGRLRTPLELAAGAHRLRLRVRARGAAQVRCALEPVRRALDVFPPPDPLPDVRGGEVMGEGWIAPQVLNLGAEPVTVRVTGDAEGPPATVAPGQLAALAARLPRNASCGAPLHLSIGGSALELPALRCRGRRQSFVFTFTAHDGSVAHAAAIAPRSGAGDGREKPVLLALSGVGASAESQADAHKFGKGDDFVFGLKGAWVLAPARAGAHNWEGVGLHTALAALRALERLFGADASRVFVSGHSRGGHGALMVATHRPDLAVGVMHAAGWISREHYGDANLLLSVDASLSHLQPRLRAVLEAAIAENDCSFAAANLGGTPVLARVGDADTTVAPYFTRRFARVAAAAGALVTLDELPGKEHWWWDSRATNDGGVVFDRRVRGFVRAAFSSPSPPASPSAFEVVSLNPATYAGRRGVRILQLRDRGHGRVRVAADGEMRTSFVRALALDSGCARVVIDGQEVRGPASGGCVLRGPRPWAVVPAGELLPGRPPEQYGPARQVFDSPALVVPAPGWEPMAVFVANSHLVASGTRLHIVAPEDLGRWPLADYNLVLLGGDEPRGAVPAGRSSAGLTVGPLALGPGCGLLYTRPRGRARLDLVVDATDAAGMAALMSGSFSWNQPLTRAVFTNMVPDFMAVSAERLYDRGLDGILAAGFWGNEWEWDVGSVYLA